MAEQPVAFTHENALRILSATEVVERLEKNLPAPIPRAKKPTVGFYARITDNDEHKYSWEAVALDDSQEMATQSDQWEGDHSKDSGYAVDIYKCEDVIHEDIVWLDGARTENIMVFEYHGGVRAAVASGNITAGSSGQAGYGNATVDTIDIDTGVLSAGQDVKVWNNLSQSVDDGTKIQITYGRGAWWLSAADCPPET